jgi:hypothetical protein
LIFEIILRFSSSFVLKADGKKIRFAAACLDRKKRIENVGKNVRKILQKNQTTKFCRPTICPLSSIFKAKENRNFSIKKHLIQTLY